jgi:hypothetical protein
VDLQVIRKKLLRHGVRAFGALTNDRGLLLKGLDDLGYVPNLSRPRTFNEKILARKLGSVDPKWTLLADKVAVRDYVSRLVGPEILNEVYLVTDDPEEIRFDQLPESFVVKANHGCGWNILVPNKAAVSEARVREICRAWLGRRFGAPQLEHWYDAIPPRILVERLLIDAEHGIPFDYKIGVFHGRAEHLQVACWRFLDPVDVYYDREWRRLPWIRNHPPGPDQPRPCRLNDLISIAERLADGMDYVRVDLYCVDDRKIIFGELTLAPGGGWDGFKPMRYDREVGALW